MKVPDCFFFGFFFGGGGGIRRHVPIFFLMGYTQEESRVETGGKVYTRRIQFLQTLPVVTD